MKKFFALCLAAAMVLSLAACGSNEKAEETQAASAKKWVVATDTVFKPFEYTDASGNFVGIDVDILAAVAADQKFEYELKSLGCCHCRLPGRPGGRHDCRCLHYR